MTRDDSQISDSKYRQLVIDLFYKNVKGKKPDVSGSNKKHAGKEGHWLETQMGVKHNASNTPDLYGFEMKNETGSKTTFGDWSANYYIYKDPQYQITRNRFMEIFGKPNEQKGGRYSWSGQPCPKVNSYNSFGQILSIDSDGDILALYSYKNDKRENKNSIVPHGMQIENLVLAKWNRETLEKRVNSKFNNRGWFKCRKNSDGFYSSIVFGEPLNFDKWIKDVGLGLIIFDSGMYQGNSRNYSEWRANNNYWDRLIVSEY